MNNLIYRNPQRIGEICNILADAWSQKSQWTFSKFIDNFEWYIGQTFNIRRFYDIDNDNDLLHMLDCYCKYLKERDNEN